MLTLHWLKDFNVMRFYIHIIVISDIDGKPYSNIIQKLIAYGVGTSNQVLVHALC